MGEWEGDSRVGRHSRVSPRQMDGDSKVKLEAKGTLFTEDLNQRNGTLCVDTQRLTFQPSAQTKTNDQKQIHLKYEAIAMHAVCRDTSAFPHECIYLQLDPQHTNHFQNNFQTQEMQDSEAWVELRFVPAPEDPSSLDDIYSALCECAALNPDNEDDAIKLCDDGDDCYYTSEEGLAEATSEQLSMLDRYENLLTNSGQVRTRHHSATLEHPEVCDDSKISSPSQQANGVFDDAEEE